MPFTQGVDKATLTPIAATAFEANLFKENHPEFFVCEANTRAMLNYLEQHKLGCIYENFEKAFAQLTSEGRLLYPSSATLAKMTAKEAESLARHNGTPRYGSGGKIIGYDWDEQWHHLTPVETEDAPTRLRKNQMQWPEDYGRIPTKREVAMWPSARYDEWLDANGHRGHELPEELR
jgi:hypothetical protein